MTDAIEIANWCDNNPVVQAMKQAAYDRGVAEGEKRGRTAEAAEPPEPCPLEHRCGDGPSCGCWCDLHDVRMDECPTFRLVTGWLADAEERGRTAAAADIRAALAADCRYGEWYAANIERLDEIDDDMTHARVVAYYLDAVTPSISQESTR